MHLNLKKIAITLLIICMGFLIAYTWFGDLIYLKITVTIGAIFFSIIMLDAILDS